MGACGGLHTLAVLQDGSLYAWGDNSQVLPRVLVAGRWAHKAGGWWWRAGGQTRQEGGVGETLTGMGAPERPRVQGQLGQGDRLARMVPVRVRLGATCLRQPLVQDGPDELAGAHRRGEAGGGGASEERVSMAAGGFEFSVAVTLAGCAPRPPRPPHCLVPLSCGLSTSLPCGLSLLCAFILALLALALTPEFPPVAANPRTCPCFCLLLFLHRLQARVGLALLECSFQPPGGGIRSTKHWHTEKRVPPPAAAGRAGAKARYCGLRALEVR